MCCNFHSYSACSIAVLRSLDGIEMRILVPLPRRFRVWLNKYYIYI